MGTANEWMGAVFWGMLWAGGMVLLDVRARGNKAVRAVISIENLLSCAFLGLGVGVATTFRWKPFRSSLILFVVCTFVIGGILGMLAKRRLRREDQRL